VLPPAFHHLVQATPDLFIQPIYDLAVPRMAFGRVALLGDAAFVPRPHTAASTAKAALNARMLGEAVQAHGRDVTAALRAWEPAQLRYGNQLKMSGKAMGDRSQFSRT
jgi:2-polyprenyl-6-methoxyphenol hydroxylase-like FAD-dependent oxidoreductase